MKTKLNPTKPRRHIGNVMGKLCRDAIRCKRCKPNFKGEKDNGVWCGKHKKRYDELFNQIKGIWHDR
jgi:hypothetical protein